MRWSTFLARGLAVFFRGTYHPPWSPPGRLVERLAPGMTMGELRMHATQLGFRWGVRDEDARGPLHVLCHRTGPEAPVGEWVCERASDLTSVGGLYGSYTCNVVLLDGVVTERWFYQD